LYFEKEPEIINDNLKFIDLTTIIEKIHEIFGPILLHDNGFPDYPALDIRQAGP